MPKVIGLLHPQPQIGTVAAELAEPKRHSRSDQSFFGKDAVEQLPCHPEIPGNPYRPPQRLQNILAKKLPGMNRGTVRIAPPVPRGHRSSRDRLTPRAAARCALTPYRGRRPHARDHIVPEDPSRTTPSSRNSAQAATQCLPSPASPHARAARFGSVERRLLFPPRKQSASWAAKSLPAALRPDERVAVFSPWFFLFHESRRSAS